MGIGIDHRAWNFTFGAPKGEEDRVKPLRVFITTNPQETMITSVTCEWELTDEEIADIVATKRIMINTMGSSLLAHFITSPKFMRQFVTAYGRTWDA